MSRARATGAKVAFWLDQDANRAHDANLIGLIKKYLGDHDPTDIDIEFLKPVDAFTGAYDHAKEGFDTIGTGNMLLIDLFTILKLGLGTSAKILSIIPLLSCGFQLETSAGGFAPKYESFNSYTDYFVSIPVRALHPLCPDSF